MKLRRELRLKKLGAPGVTERAFISDYIKKGLKVFYEVPTSINKRGGQVGYLRRDGERERGVTVC